MDAAASENASFVMLHEASEGKDISNRYNSLSLPEQRQVLTSMRQMQSEMMAQFGNVELFDSDNDGILDDAKAHLKDKNNNQLVDKDVYNPFGVKQQSEKIQMSDAARTGETQSSDGVSPDAGGFKNVSRAADTVPHLSQSDINRDPLLRQADNLLRTASHGGDIYRQYSRLDPQSASQMLQAMEIVQAAKPEAYGHVKLIDADKNGVLDDVRVQKMTNAGAAEIDAFKTPADLQAARLQKDMTDGVGRAGQIILEEGIRGIGRSHGPSTGDRIQRRIGNEAIYGTNRIIRDVLGQR